MGGTKPKTTLGQRSGPNRRNSKNLQLAVVDSTDSSSSSSDSSDADWLNRQMLAKKRRPKQRFSSTSRKAKKPTEIEDPPHSNAGVSHVSPANGNSVSFDDEPRDQQPCCEVRKTGESSLSHTSVEGHGAAVPTSTVDGLQPETKLVQLPNSEFKRVDQVWDSDVRSYKLQDTAHDSLDAKYDGYLFHVRRTFGARGRHDHTFVDVKSELLREALQEVMGEIKGVSLVEETPSLDPNLLFLYLEDMRVHIEALGKGSKEDDHRQRSEKKQQQLKVLVQYLDTDFAAIKHTLGPMLEHGLITYDLLWALWKPSTLGFTATHGLHDQPRVFKTEIAEKKFLLAKGHFYVVEGKYIDYNGECFGFSSITDVINEFRGARKITSLPMYPLKYHKSADRLRSELVERGKKFVALSGAQHKRYDDMAFYMKEKSIVKVHIRGRIMIDSKVHQRINPNYPSSTVRPTDETAFASGQGFREEEYLIASPVVLGFAFSEKIWLEFMVTGVQDIQWDDKAYESLVLEPKTKDIVRALVESHKSRILQSMDDVIQGNERGLVAVLHGPPGTGKTLTAEGISELVRCPLYTVSAGELGSEPRILESDLETILDICHAWGAILLLDEADVFLEKRNMHDIYRNALVSIFLRQLEYFQGILFLTTNRVETFDDAFQSRIHIALRYGSLNGRAKKAIFRTFIERSRILEQTGLAPISEEELDRLARTELNGRQIKNTVRTALALAVHKREPMSIEHIQQVLEVQMSFERDLKCGPGFQDAMRSYF